MNHETMNHETMNHDERVQLIILAFLVEGVII